MKNKHPVWTKLDWRGPRPLTLRELIMKSNFDRMMVYLADDIYTDEEIKESARLGFSRVRNEVLERLFTPEEIIEIKKIHKKRLDEENARYDAADEEERKQKEQETAMRLEMRKKAERKKREEWYRKRRQSRRNHPKKKRHGKHN